eukprot:Gb_15254 [translate_table: standard]
MEEGCFRSGVTTNDRATIGGEGRRVERAMPTSNQSICHGREKKRRTNRTQASDKCLRSKEYARVARTPKKPNPTPRKIAKVRLSNRHDIFAYIPGEGHNLQEHPMVSIRGGRVKDLPGAKFHRIRGVKDSLGTPGRRRGRSKHGAKRPKTIRMKDVIRVLPFGIVPDRPPISTLLRYRPRRTENEKHLYDRELAEKDGQKQSHNINSLAREGGGPLSSKPKGRRAGTYNCSKILSYIGRLDGGQKQLINKLVNFRTINGERTRARAIAHQTFHRSAQTERDVTNLLVNIVENIKPKCEVGKVRVAGTTHNVLEIAARDHQQTLAIRWILGAAFKRRISNRIGSNKCSSAKIPDAYRKRGLARKKRDDPHEPTPTNRSSAHLRWWNRSKIFGPQHPKSRATTLRFPTVGGNLIWLDRIGTAQARDVYETWDSDWGGGAPSLKSNLGGSCPGARSNFGNRVVPGNDGLAIKLDEVAWGKSLWDRRDHGSTSCTTRESSPFPDPASYSLRSFGGCRPNEPPGRIAMIGVFSFTQIKLLAHPIARLFIFPSTTWVAYLPWPGFRSQQPGSPWTLWDHGHTPDSNLIEAATGKPYLFEVLRSLAPSFGPASSPNNECPYSSVAISN